MSEKKMYNYLVWFLISFVLVVSTVVLAIINKSFFESTSFYVVTLFNVLNFVLAIFAAVEIIEVELYLNKVQDYYFNIGVYVYKSLYSKQWVINFGLIFFSINIKF